MSRLPSTTTVRTGTSNRISIEIFSFIYQNVKTVLIFHFRETCERSARDEESKYENWGSYHIPPNKSTNPPRRKVSVRRATDVTSLRLRPCHHAMRHAACPISFSRYRWMWLFEGVRVKTSQHDERNKDQIYRASQVKGRLSSL